MVGVSASGKSTFARKLARRYDLPLTHMDAILWKPGWEEANEEEVASHLELIAQGEAWIIEGYIPKVTRSLMFERADVIVYLDYSRTIVARWYIQRWWEHTQVCSP